MGIIFSAMGFLSPANRGALIMAQLLLYVLMGSVAGYTTARVYKTFKGKSWQKATTLTALLYPGICFGVFFILDLAAWYEGSFVGIVVWNIDSFGVFGCLLWIQTRSF